jgi:MoaA/NifB/PqqE/SkfB family radical SAM enzyme
LVIWAGVFLSGVLTACGGESRRASWTGTRTEARVERDARHEAGLRLFEAHEFEAAALELRAALEENPTSEKWNDWAAAEAICGKSAEAMKGFSNALTLDPGNRQAVENLRYLQDKQAATPAFNILQDGQCGSGSPRRGEQGNRNPFAEKEKALDAKFSGAMSSYFQELERIPAHDPALRHEMREAFRWANSDSSYFVKTAYERLAAVSGAAQLAILRRLEEQAGRDYRFLSVVALDAIEKRDWERALSLLDAAADRNWADLFIERQRILCEELRQKAEPDKTSTFAGLEEHLATRFCTAPWENMEITSWGTEIEQTGDVYHCCPAWLPPVIGNAREQTADKIWNSVAAQEVRKSIHGGSYRYCSKAHCNWISGRALPSREEVLGRERARSEEGKEKATLEELYPLEMSKGPANVTLSYDRSCNLACPSCRTDYYSATKSQQEQLHKFFGEFVKSVVKDARQIYMDGAGETFASKHSREVLKSLNRRDYPELKFRFLTNGQLFDRRAYEEFDLRGRLERVDVSIDSARPETFAVIRKGGTLKRLLANVEFLDGLRQRGEEKFWLSFRFVISALNYREIPEVIRLAKNYHLDEV